MGIAANKIGILRGSLVAHVLSKGVGTRVFQLAIELTDTFGSTIYKVNDSPVV
jgi:hypothetical protein